MTTRIPLVLLPGLLNDAALWAHQAETLGDVADIVIPDLNRFDNIAVAARTVLSEVPETFALAGLSMGGYLAQEIMRQAPDRILKLALLDTSSHADTPEQMTRRRALIDLTRQGDFKGVTRRLLPMLIHPDHVKDETIAETVMTMAEKTGRDAFIRQQTLIMTRPDSTRDLGAIHCPSVVICGRQDTLTPVAFHEEMANGMANAKLVVIEGSGHLTPIEQPYAVSAIFRYWLAD